MWFCTEIQDLASLYRNCVGAAGLSSLFQGGTSFLKQKANKKGGGVVCGKEEKGYFKMELCCSISAAILIFAQFNALKQFHFYF